MSLKPIADASPLRLGAVSYLNSKPLIEGLEKRLSGLGTLSLDLPSRLADRLHHRDLDAALIPSVECFHTPGFLRISNACIACRGPVWSVRLLFRCSPERVQTLALDEGSRTSAALSRVLLHMRYGIVPKTRILGMQESILDDTHDVDAVLVIGDRAMDVAPKFSWEWDLGAAWYQETGLPFVFATWVCHPRELPESTKEPLVSKEPGLRSRDGSNLASLSNLLEGARDDGMANLSEIALRYGPEAGVSPEDAENYFRKYLRFHLGSDELRGLETFRNYFLTRLPSETSRLVSASDDGSSHR